MLFLYSPLIKEGSTSARTVSANWSNLTDYSRNKDEITQLIVNPLDRSLRAMKDNLASQEFVVDDTGILGRKKEKSGDFSSEQLRIVNNTLMFTKDNWNTASLALGKVGNKYGLVADVIVGTLLMGEELQIKNSSNTISLDENGIAVYNSSNTQVFKASTKGDVYIKGKVEATSGKIGKIDIRNDGSIISANGNFIVDANGNLTASSATIKGNVTATSGTIGNITINSDGSIVSANKNFSVDANGNLIASGGTLGGFTIGSAIYSGRTALDSGGTPGVYIGTDGISLGVNTTTNSPMIYMTKEGKFVAVDATISGIATLESATIDDLTAKTANISKLVSKELLVNKLGFTNNQYNITIGSNGENDQIRATVSQVTSGSMGGYSVTTTVVLRNASTGALYASPAAKDFQIVFTSSDGWFGKKTYNIAVCVNANSTSGSVVTHGAYKFNGDATFSSNGNTTYLYPANNSTMGFVINGALLAASGGSYNIGSASCRFKTIYCDEIVCAKMNGTPQDGG